MGTASNIPASNDQSVATSPLRNNEDNRKSKTQTYEINRTVTSTQKAPGAIKMVTSAVFIAPRVKTNGADNSPAARTAEELDGLRQMVVNTLGITAETPADLARIVSVQEVPFETAPAGSAVSPETILGYVETIRPLATLLVAGVIFFIFVRMLRRARNATQIELLGGEEQRMLTSRSPSAVTGRELVSPEMLNELIRQKPDNVAAALRGWLSQKDQKTS